MAERAAMRESSSPVARRARLIRVSAGEASRSLARHFVG
jgi:hypothetical protein